MTMTAFLSLVLAASIEPATPIEARAGSEFCVDTTVQVATAEKIVCGRCADGRVFCAGDAALELIRGGPLKDRPPIAWVEGISDARDLAVSGSTICVLRAGGLLQCLTDDSEWFSGAEDVPDAFRVRGRGDEVEASLGFRQICMLRKTGNVLCLDTGRLFHLHRAASPEVKAVEVKGLHDAIQLTAGTGHTCTLKRDGTVACWGENFERQLGFDSSDRSPRTANLRPFAGCDDPCGCKSRTYLKAFTYRQPQVVPKLQNVAEVRSGAAATCARTTDGRVWCWGPNALGELGDGASQEPPDRDDDVGFGRATPAPVVGLTDAIALDLANNHACAVRRTGQVVCWGTPRWGRAQKVPTPLAGLPVAQRVVTGSEIAFIQDRDGHWLHWGADFMRSRTPGTVKAPVRLPY
jgi:hypothetical protein